MGIRPQTLRNWEEDRAEPRANRLQMLAGMLDVSLVWLMSGRGRGAAGRRARRRSRGRPRVRASPISGACAPSRCGSAERLGAARAAAASLR